MPTSAGPNSKGENSLVFAIDIADTRNSYKGQPVTNIWESGDPNGHGSILRKINTDKWLGKVIESGVVYHNIVNRRATTDSPDKTFFNNGGLNMGSMNFRTLNPATKYIQISFDYYGVEPYQRYCCPHLGLNGYLGISYTDGTTNTSGWDTTYSPGTSDDWNNLEENMGKWQRISLIATVDPNREAQGIWAFYIYYDSLMGGEGYFANLMFSEHSSYPTGPVRFTSFERLSTEALFDLTKKTSINLTNVSFDSNGQITFDGTDDYLTLPDIDTYSSTAKFTIEGVVRAIGGNWSRIFTNGSNGVPGSVTGFINTDLIIYTNSNRPYIILRVGNSYITLGSSNQVSTNTWGGDDFVMYFAFSANKENRTGTYLFRFGQNNGLIQEELSGTYTPGTATGFVENRLGAETDNESYAQMDMYMFKMYNRELSLDEMRKNYNVIKGRFNI